MDNYKIVNATQLDADLQTIADALKQRIEDAETDIDETDETLNYTFPESYSFPKDFSDVIDHLSYNKNIKDENNLSFNEETNSIDVDEGFYNTSVSFDLTTLNPELDNFTITPGDEDITLEVAQKYCSENIIISAVDEETYLNKETESITEPKLYFTDSTQTEIIIPAGYYAEDSIIKIEDITVKEEPSDET